MAGSLAASIGLAVGCSRGPARSDDRGGGPTPPSALDASAQAASLATVTVQGSAGATTVNVEVVKSRGMVQKGLMYRQYMAPDAGMLFLMDAEDTHRFWMKNTLIPLDILFIGKDLRVVGILHDMKPHDTAPKGVAQPSLYVLEVNAGWSKLHGVGPGSSVQFHDVEAVAR
jgi:uncharacterized membrane protein (UPF0127 family)